MKEFDKTDGGYYDLLVMIEFKCELWSNSSENDYWIPVRWESDFEGAITEKSWHLHSLSMQ